MEKSREQLIEGAEYYHNILLLMIDMLIVTEPDGLIKIVNPATIKILEFTEDDLIGKSMNILFAEKDEDLLSLIFEKAETMICRDYRN